MYNYDNKILPLSRQSLHTTNSWYFGANEDSQIQVLTLKYIKSCHYPDETV